MNRRPNPPQLGRYELFVGGEWISPREARFMPSINPFDESAWAQIPDASAADVVAAMDAASDAFRRVWRRTPGVRRAELLHMLADALDRDADRMAQIETTDNGKVIRETSTQMRFAARNYRFHAGLADKLSGESKPLDDWDVLDYTTLEPLGVVALITAWNSPMQLLANKLAPALAAGNCVVIKPSEHTSASTLELAKLIEEVGFPPGVVNVVTGGVAVGTALAGHPTLGRISFTGSNRVGADIAAMAAANIVPVTLELGGKSANIIFRDADLDRAIPGAVAGIFAAAGQTCIAGSRLLVDSSIYDEVVDGVTRRARAVRLGNPLDRATEMGPVAHRAQRDSILTKVGAAVAAGAVALAGGRVADVDAPGQLFVEPTVLGNVTNGMAIAQEEIFGPVLSVIRYEDEDEAVAIANDSRFGLAAGVWTQDVSRAHRVAKELDCGTVWVNTYRRSAAQAPFGGVKGSGYGRERGVESIRDYVRIKNTMVDLSTTELDPFTIRT